VIREDVRAGRFRRLCVFKLVADTYCVVDELRRAGCTLVAVADHLTIRPDADDIASEAIVFALPLAARLERTTINDRIAAARARLAAQGKPWGRPSRLTQQDRARLPDLHERGLSDARGGVGKRKRRMLTPRRWRARFRRSSAHSALHSRAVTESQPSPRRARRRRAVPPEQPHSEQRQRTVTAP
jgi:DNA invertase Pin-like site-specific DNA recombinase